MVIPEDNWLTPNSLRQPRYPSPPLRRMGNPAISVEGHSRTQRFNIDGKWEFPKWTEVRLAYP